ncbi:MAG: D-hexose-6-phosphate mutarotase [Pseudomonadota bacterium]
MTSMTTFGALPAVCITAPGGAQAIVTLYGAHLVSWQSAAGKERLFVSERSPRDGSAAIRGGVPVIFPQFATRGTGQRHGLARLSTWRLDGSGTDNDSGWAEFELARDDVPAALAQAWPHAFTLRLRVTLRGDALELRFKVRNSGEQDFAFASALHTYFAVGEFGRSTLQGLQGQDTLRFGEALDTIHPATPELTLETADGALLLQQQGYTEWVVWNPGAAGAAAIGDMDDAEYRDFVCIEPARVDQKVLAAGAEWTGYHTISSIP